MALPLAKAAPLKPEIRLAQALSEFEAVLIDDQKIKLRTYRGQTPPNPTDVMRLTSEIDRDASRNRKSRQCVGTRLTNVLNSVQQFSTVVDLIVGSSRSQIAGAIWGTVKLSLQLASAISSYFDQLSTLFMRIGLTCPRYQDFGLLYPDSTRLQSALCEYFVVIVCLCKQAVLFLKKPIWSQLSSSILKPFESEFGACHQRLENLANAIREEVSLASNQAQQNEATEMSKFRAFAIKKFSDTSARDLGETRIWKRKKAELLFLNACSDYNHEKSWKQSRKRGNANWICCDEGYKQWKQEKVSNTLWCTGILGSGKTVLAASVVEDLKITTPAVVAYFFCRHDEAESLQTRTIIGSIARQIFDYLKPDIVDEITNMRSGTFDTDQILDYIRKLLPSNSHGYFIIIDGLDECEEKESRLLLQCLKQLLMSKTPLRVYCASRPDVSRWAPAVLEPQWNIFMSQTSSNIEEYIENTLDQCLGSGNLSIGDPTIILTIRDALLENAHGMFLWVAFQIDSLCSQKTDAAILTALKDLPRDLADTFNRILRKLQHSDAADLHFCKKIFDILAGAQRPLTLEELREAVSVEPGNTIWDASQLVNNMLKLLLDSCGSLVNIDEEHLTVHFAHHSVKQHLLSEPRDSDLEMYHVDIKEADRYLGDIIVTYLNFGIFDQQLTKANPSILPQIINYPSAILGSLPGPSFANKWAMLLLKSRGNPGLDIHSQLKTAAGVVQGSKAQIQPSYPFLSYAQEHWLFHTKFFHLSAHPRYHLWQLLIDGEVETIKVPWTSKERDEFGDEYVKWIIQNKHWALIDQSFGKITASLSWNNSAKQNARRGARLLLDFLEKSSAENWDIDLDVVFHLASRLNYERIVLILLRKGVNVNAEGGPYGTALQEASFNGNENIARVLLENGANVNIEGGSCGTALQAASASGHEEIARLLLANGANANAEGGSFATALQAASYRGYEKITRLLLDNGANINADDGVFGTALNAASYGGHEKTAILLLERGADVNVDMPLKAAARNGHKAVVRLLLDNGAVVDRQIMEAASYFREEEVKRLIHDAFNLQSSLVRDPALSSRGEPSQSSG